MLDNDLRALLGRIHPAFHQLPLRTRKINEQAHRLLAQINTGLRRSARIGAALDVTVAIWHRLVEAFCETIAPFLDRCFLETRLVATLDTDGAPRLHRIIRSKDGVPVVVPEPSDPAALANTRWTHVELRLRPDQVFTRTLALPTASRQFLGPILDHRMERLTPWKPDTVIYGYRIDDSSSDGNSVSVELVATSRDIIAAPTARLEALGLVPTAIGAENGSLGAPLSLVLRRSDGKSLRPAAHRIVSRVAMVAFALLGLLLVLTAIQSSSAGDARDATVAQLVKARRLLRASSRGDVAGPERAMLDAKTPGRAMVVLIDKLAGTIPSDTFLTQLVVTADKVRLVGMSANAVALVGQLETAGFANARFASGVTREKDGRDHFEIVGERHVPTETAP